MALSVCAAGEAKPKEKAYKLTDGAGLYFNVQPGGSKLWWLKYRYLGKEKLLSFGPYLLVTIAEARPDAEAKRRQTFGLLADE